MAKDKESTAPELCNVITKHAKKKFSSKLAFATACDLDERTIRRIYSGRYNPSIKTLDKISIALEVRPSELLEEIGR